jgi:hypothetical protein
MAIVVLVLWLFTAGAGLSLLVTSNLARARPAEPASAEPAAPALASAATPPTPASATTHAPAPTPASEHASGEHASRREARRAARGRFDTPSLVAARKAPIVPGLRPLLEFAHPVCALAGLAFWLGFTLVHNRGLGWVAFGLLAVTACAGLAWFTANARTAAARTRPGPKPSFSGRLAVVHGAAAAVTVALAALAALAIGLRAQESGQCTRLPCTDRGRRADHEPGSVSRINGS